MSLADEAAERIDREELIALALEICNIDSSGPNEGTVGQYIYDWMRREGFEPRKLGLLIDRFNVMGVMPGAGNGFSLLLNSHLDTAVRENDRWTYKDPTDDVYHRAWIEGDSLVGEGVVNDKGPLAAFLIAAKAVKSTGRRLKGDLVLTAVVAETSAEPSDEPLGTFIETKDLGARFLATHGGVADYALVAEGTGFSLVSVEAGMAWYRITWTSAEPAFYAPYLPDRTTPQESPNMIVRASVAVLALERWADGYQSRYAYESSGGPVVPKALVGAIRGGNPRRPVNAPQVCSLYLGVFTVPQQDPGDLKREIGEALYEAGVPANDIQLYLFRRGYEARGVERLEEALLRAHRAVLHSEPPPPYPATCSMWRDVNVFNEMGIPAMTYGPRSSTHSFTRALTIESLYQAACVYARTIVEICNQEKPEPAR
jgi:acetylornithine deacetylase/succinyl-diaminopimelate desuccinylase-like protein